MMMKKKSGGSKHPTINKKGSKAGGHVKKHNKHGGKKGGVSNHQASDEDDVEVGEEDYAFVDEYAQYANSFLIR